MWLEDGFNNFNNYDGHSAGLLIGKAANSPKKRTIIKFDVAAAGVPGNAAILNAQMKLRYYGVGGTSACVDRWVQAHQLLVDWNEQQATRDQRLFEETPINWAAPFRMTIVKQDCSLLFSFCF